MKTAIITGFVAGIVVIAGIGHAADKPQNKPLTCSEQWQKITASTKPDKAAMKSYAVKCSAKTNASSKVEAMSQDRLGACKARWAQMKAANAINGQSYEEFSAQCLIGAPRK